MIIAVQKREVKAKINLSGESFFHTGVEENLGPMLKMVL